MNAAILLAFAVAGLGAFVGAVWLMSCALGLVAWWRQGSRTGADAALLEAIKRHVKERAGPWKYPRWFDIRQELPKTPTGKTQRFKLRQPSEA